jgi:hypothetical protein
LGRGQRSDHRHTQRPPSHPLGTPPAVSIVVCDPIWIQLHHPLVRAKLGKPNRAAHLRDSLFHAGRHIADTRRCSVSFPDPN